MNTIFDFIARHAVIGTLVFAAILILTGLGLLFRPGLIVFVLRYGFAVGNIAGGMILLIRTLRRAKK